MKLELFEYTATSANFSFSHVAILKFSGIFGATLNGLMINFFGAPAAPAEGIALLCVLIKLSEHAHE
jgi:hypothetical protein